MGLGAPLVPDLEDIFNRICTEPVYNGQVGPIPMLGPEYGMMLGARRRLPAGDRRLPDDPLPPGLAAATARWSVWVAAGLWCGFMPWVFCFSPWEF